MKKAKTSEEDSKELERCSQCGQWAIYCSISVRYHCEECGNWSPSNWDMNLETCKASAIKLWNDSNKVD